MFLKNLLILFFVVATNALGQHTAIVDGIAEPYLLPTDLASRNFTVIVSGSGFGTRAKQPSDLVCHAKVAGWGFARPSIHKAKGPAIVLNDNKIQCTFTGLNVEGPGGITVESDSHSNPAKKIWWSHGSAKVEFRTLVKATPDRRPYLSDEVMKAELLLAVDREAISRISLTSEAKTIEICATLEPSSLKNPMLPQEFLLPHNLIGLELLPCTELQLDEIVGGDGHLHWSSMQTAEATVGTNAYTNSTVVFSVPFNQTALRLLPESVTAAEVAIRTKIGSFEVDTKRRVFAVASSKKLSAKQGFTTVDHRRRMIRYNDKPWIGVGFYYSHLMHDANISLSIERMREHAYQGLTQVMPYGLDTVSEIERKQFVDALDEMTDKTGDSKMLFDFPLVEYVEKICKSQIGSSNYTSAWNDLKSKVESVKQSKSLLGYYICDDCNTNSFPPLCLAQVYQVMKAMYPYHILIGAPWAEPFSLYSFGEDVGLLAFDYGQVENYHPNPGHTLGDGKIRIGNFFEPIANSPPSYLLQGLGGNPKQGPPIWNGKYGVPAPPVLEETLSFLGAMTFAGANIVNFVDWAPNVGRIVKYDLDLVDHIDAQASYSRKAKLLLSAMLPDLTDPVNGRRLNVRVANATKCNAPATLPKTSSRPFVDFQKQSSVVAFGIKESVDCAFVIAVNLCSTPSQYSLQFDQAEIPNVKVATHVFNEMYNVTFVGDKNELELESDWLGGYSNSIIRLGCNDWNGVPPEIA
eukprot:g6346.t1